MQASFKLTKQDDIPNRFKSIKNVQGKAEACEEVAVLGAAMILEAE